MMLSMRPGDSAPALTFLEWLDNEKYLQMGMMADGADEASRTVVTLDAGIIGESDVQSECSRFLESVDLLYLQGYCLQKPGFTLFAFQALETSRVTVPHTRNGPPKSFGGLDPVPQDMKHRCLKRMAAWVLLARAIIKSEFPDFELCACFAVFNLEEVVPGPAARTGCMGPLHILARAFGVQPVEAVQEYFSLLPIAHVFFKRPDCPSTMDAWRQAVANAGARTDRQRKTYCRSSSGTLLGGSVPLPLGGRGGLKLPRSAAGSPRTEM